MTFRPPPPESIIILNDTIICSSRQSKMSGLLELCESDDLSLDALQEIVDTLGSLVSSQSQLCLHQACFCKKVTLKIVQLLQCIVIQFFRNITLDEIKGRSSYMCYDLLNTTIDGIVYIQIYRMTSQSSAHEWSCRVLRQRRWYSLFRRQRISGSIFSLVTNDAIISMIIEKQK